MVIIVLIFQKYLNNQIDKKVLLCVYDFISNFINYLFQFY